MLKKYAIATMLLFCNAVYAAPYITEVTKTATAGKFTSYNFSWAASDGRTNSDPVPTCIGRVNCRLQLLLMEPGQTVGSGKGDLNAFASRKNGKDVTWDQLFEAWNKISRSSGSDLYYGLYPVTTDRKVCLGFYASEYTSSYIPPEILVPNYECMVFPPGVNSCAAANDNLDFNFGSLSPAEVSGAKRTQGLTIACTAPTNITLQKIYTEGEVDEVAIRPGELYAKITLNGQPINKGHSVALEAGDNAVELTTELRAVGKPKAGEFSAQSILLIKYM